MARRGREHAGSAVGHGNETRALLPSRRVEVASMRDRLWDGFEGVFVAPYLESRSRACWIGCGTRPARRSTGASVEVEGMLDR